MKRKPDTTGSLCDCGAPAMRAGQPLKGAPQLANGCERCLALESSGTNYPETAGVPYHRSQDRTLRVSTETLAAISAACDAALERRGIGPARFNPAFA